MREYDAFGTARRAAAVNNVVGITVGNLGCGRLGLTGPTRQFVVILKYVWQSRDRRRSSQNEAFVRNLSQFMPDRSQWLRKIGTRDDRLRIGILKECGQSLPAEKRTERHATAPIFAAAQ